LASSAGLEAATVAVLAIGPVAAGVMCTTMVKGWVALAASAPTMQVTVPAVLVHPALAETKLTWAGSTSVTVPPLEVEGPLLVTRSEERRVGKEVGVWGALLVIARSATRWAVVVATAALVAALWSSR